jgi:F-type H+-transporting ATPase subunit b
MHIDFWGLTLQAINFAVLAWLLRRFLYRPILAMIDQRQALVEKDFHEARQARHQAEVHLKGYEERIAEIAAERELLLAEARTHIEVERREVLVHAETEAASVIENQRRALEEERRAAADQLGQRAIDLGLELARQLLSSFSSAAIAEALLEGMCRRLDELPPERLRDRGPTLVVGTAPALDEAAQTRWRERLGRYLDPGTEMVFVHDEALIAGAELRFPSLVIVFSWRDSLEQARASMVVGS